MAARDDFEALCTRIATERGWLFDGDHFDAKLEDGRHQKVLLDYFDFEGTELVRVYTLIGSIREIEPLRLTQALRLNFGLPHGALAVRADDLVMTDTLVVEDADEGEIEGVVVYLAETGDHFEKTIFGPDQH